MSNAGFYETGIDEVVETGILSNPCRKPLAARRVEPGVPKVPPVVVGNPLPGFHFERIPRTGQAAL